MVYLPSILLSAVPSFESGELICEAERALRESGAGLAVVVDRERYSGILQHARLAELLARRPEMARQSLATLGALPAPQVHSGTSPLAIRRMLAETDLPYVPLLDGKGRVSKLLSREEALGLGLYDNPVAIMAGGFGIRLRPITQNIPKPLLPLVDSNMLEWILDHLVDCGFHRFYVAVHYLKEQIISYLGDGQQRGVSIEYIEEESPRGTAGSLRMLKSREEMPILVTNGDVITNQHCGEVLRHHQRHDAELTVVCKEDSVDISYGVVECGSGRYAGEHQRETAPQLPNQHGHLRRRAIGARSRARPPVLHDRSDEQRARRGRQSKRVQDTRVLARCGHLGLLRPGGQGHSLGAGAVVLGSVHSEQQRAGPAAQRRRRAGRDGPGSELARRRDRVAGAVARTARAALRTAIAAILRACHSPSSVSSLSRPCETSCSAYCSLVSVPALRDAMAHLLGRGKLFRPLLALASVQAVAGEDPSAAIPLVAPLELIHTFSLIHDDLPCMDDADLRRGLSSVHVAHGEALAVLAGDALLNLAHYCLATRGSIPAGTRGRLLAATAQATHQVVEGQVLDLEAEQRDLSLDELRRLDEKKTGALIGACCEAGAILGGAGEALAQRMRELGVRIGWAFQLRDDLLSVQGDEKRVGKTLNVDARKQKATSPRLLGVESTERMLSELLADVSREINALGLREAGLLQEFATLAGQRES